MKNSFFDIIADSELDEFASYQIVSAALIENNIELIIQVRIDTDNSTQRWKLICRSEREHSLILGDSGYTPEVSKDHVVLWPHIKPILVLSFRGSIENSAPIVGHLYEKHWELVGNHIPFHRYLNVYHPNQLTALLAGKYGVLAEGPEPLILAYQQVLKEYGFQASTMKRASRYWDGKEYVERDIDLVALIVGQSYIIASSIEAVEAE